MLQGLSLDGLYTTINNTKDGQALQLGRLVSHGYSTGSSSFLCCLPINDNGRVEESLEVGIICQKARTADGYDLSLYCQLSMRHQTAQKCSCHGRTACLKEAEETTSHNLRPAPPFAAPVLQYLCCKAQVVLTAQGKVLGLDAPMATPDASSRLLVLTG
ncbi:uncharacterized protein LOC144133715 [Amblyomma americanum]